MNKDVLSIFFPTTYETPGQCLAFDLWKILYNAEPENQIALLKTEYHPSLTAYIKENIFTRDFQLQKFVAIGHPTKDHKKIATLVGPQFLEADWFNSVPENTVVLFFICHGAELLHQPVWKQKKWRWISFNKEFKLHYNLPYLDYQYRKLFKRFFAILSQQSDLEAIKRLMLESFDRTLGEMKLEYQDPSYNGSDIETAVQLLMHNRDVLVTEQDS